MEIKHVSFRRRGVCKTNLKKTIKAVEEEYQEDNTVNAALTWEMIKLKVREQSMMYAKTKLTNTSRIEEELEKLSIGCKRKLIVAQGTNVESKKCIEN